MVPLKSCFGPADRWSKEFHRPAGRLGVCLAHRLRGARGAAGAAGAGGGAQSVEAAAAEACQVRRDPMDPWGGLVHGEKWVYMSEHGVYPQL